MGGITGEEEERESVLEEILAREREKKFATAWLIPLGAFVSTVGFCITEWLGLAIVGATSKAGAWGIALLLALGFYSAVAWFLGMVFAVMAWDRARKKEDYLSYGLFGGILFIVSSIPIDILAAYFPHPGLFVAAVALLLGGFIVIGGVAGRL